MIKKSLAILLCFLLFAIPAYADGVDPATYIVTEHYSDDMLQDIEQTIATSADGSLTLHSPSAILVEQSTGDILFEKNSDEIRSPASITKIMSLILIMEAIENKKLNVNDTVTCSEHASSMGGSQIWLEPGEQMTVHDLLKATVVGSANDATCALAEAVAGSEDTFVSLMNEKAKELNMEHTVFKNSTGLDEEGHVTTAGDIAKMSVELLNHPMITEYASIWMDTLRNGKTQLVNTNKLVRFYEGSTGLKTGTTDEAGCCVSASATRNGLSLVAVVLGADNSNNRFSDAKTLLNYGFANFENATIPIKLPHSEIPVTGGNQSACLLSAPTEISLMIDKGTADSIETEFELANSLEAPVKQGDIIGYAILQYKGNELKKIPITAQNTVNKMNYPTALLWLLKGLITK